MPATAVQSGDMPDPHDPTTIERTTDDFDRYDGSASTSGPDPGESANWTWSFAGSP